MAQFLWDNGVCLCIVTRHVSVSQASGAKYPPRWFCPVSSLEADAYGNMPSLVVGALLPLICDDLLSQLPHSMTSPHLCA